jgi:hypothetical protein
VSTDLALPVMGHLAGPSRQPLLTVTIMR